MKKITLIFSTSLFSLVIFGQEITGLWNGALKVQGTQLRIVFTISNTINGLNTSMDSPDQGVKNIPITMTSFENSILKIAITNPKIEYEGTLGEDNIIVGTFRQSGQSFPMNLSKEAIKKVILLRPQEPKEPYAYYSEDITFENKIAGINLAGTFTLPKKEGVFPVVILISGSGPQNRNEELLGHKPFLVLSDYLTKNGIGVLRYDDRGTALSQGNFSTATSADFATDVQSAISFLKTRKEVNKKQIGLIGHSEGGLIAPMVASKSKDVAFIVLLAGTGIQGDKLLLLQQKLIGKASGISEKDLQKNEIANRKAFEIVKQSTSLAQLNNDLTAYIKQSLETNTNAAIPQGMSSEDFIKLQVKQLTSPWMQYFLKYNPSPALEKVKCAVLAINGEKDLQVPPAENLKAIKEALTKGGNYKVITKVFPNLNHLFQESTTGAPNEYAGIEQTFSPTAMAEILKWLQNQAK